MNAYLVVGLLSRGFDVSIALRASCLLVQRTITRVIMNYSKHDEMHLRCWLTV